MKIKNIKDKLFLIAAVGTSIFLLFFVVTCAWIGFDVKSQCQVAKRTYGGESARGETSCVEALITLLNDENKSYRQRNSAVWALGQLGDSRALPVLESYYTDQIPPRESLDKSISQYGLKKAINLTSGGFNMTAIFWRSGLLDN